MPNVPYLNADVRGGTLQLPTPSPQSFGYQAGVGASELGGELIKIGHRVKQQEDDLALAGKAGDYNLRLAEIHNEVLNDPSLSTTDAKLKAFKERADAFRGELNQDASPEVQRALSKHAVEALSRGLIHLTGEEYARRIDQARADVNTQQQRMAQQEGLAIAAGDSDGAMTQRTQRMELLERAQSHGTITAQERAAATKEGTHATWEMVAQRNPDFMLRLQAGVQAGEGYPAGMDPEKLQHYAQVAHWTIAGRDAEMRRLKAEAKEELEMAQDATQKQFLIEIQNGTLTVDKIINSNLKSVGDGSKEHFINVLKTRADEKSKPIKPDHGLFADLMTDIRKFRITNENDLDRYYVDSAKRGHGIDYDDLMKLRKEFEELKTPDGQTLARRKDALFDGIKHSITDSVMNRNDPQGDADFAQYQAWVNGQLDKAREQGKDPHLLLMPRIGGKENPDYLGRDDAVAPFRRTVQEQIAGMAAGLKRSERPPILGEVPESTKRKPGETYDQWRKRVR